MELLNFLNKHKNWKELLTAKPYCLEIKEDGEFVLFKYNMIDSDLILPICKEARGSIFTYERNEWRCVYRSLDKFGNWGESYAATKKIDWSKPVTVQEKIDGSIIRVWCWKGDWHISTNGTIDAFKADCGDSNYGLVFLSIFLNTSIEMINHLCAQDFLNEVFQEFNPLYTYWFEMVHPQYNQIVVHYNEPAIYFLGRRNMVTMEESVYFEVFSSLKNIRTPKVFKYSSLDDVLEACHKMGENEEGYVVCAYEQMEDGSFLRIKCKGDEYLKRHKLRGNGPLTAVKIVSLWQSDIIDDFLAYFPENEPLVSSILISIRNLSEKADIAWDVLKGYPYSRRDFALHAQTYIKPIQSYLFARLDSKVGCAQEFFKQMKAKNLAELLDIKNIGEK